MKQAASPPSNPAPSSSASPSSPIPVPASTNQLIISIVAASSVVFVGLLSVWTGYLTAQFAFSSKMAEIGVGILSADPTKSEVQPAREWAISLLEKHSGQQFTSNERKDLLKHPIQTMPAFAAKWPGPCSSWKHNSDGSWTQTQEAHPTPNLTLSGNTFRDTQETQLLDAFCGDKP